METNYNEGELRKAVVYTLFYCRVAIVLCLFFFDAEQWLLGDTEFPLLLFIILPMTVLYLVLVLKYTITRKRYFVAGEPVSKIAVTLNRTLLIALHTAELLLIYFKNRIYGDNDIISLYATIAICECVLACYAGIYLSGLFSNRPNPENTGNGV